MFRESKKEQQLDMFSNISGMLKGSAYEQYHNGEAWHNIFREQWLFRIDENMFKSLFSEKMGAPNAPVRLLLGMMTLKEAFGWSDSELFEHCRFSLLVRRALGLYHINDSIPSESTYYLFRKRIHDYQKETGIDLIERVFQQITSEQVTTFNISGRSIRMDSKLIGSNIAWSSRYELVHDTIGLFYKAMNKKHQSKLTEEILSQLNEISGTTGNKIVYRSNRDEIKQRLLKLGILSYKLLSLFENKDNKHYTTLKRIFEEQFGFDGDGQTELKPNKEISAESVQSPYDTDCSYRDKDGTKVKGYSVNLTETCDDEELNLITDVQVEKANTADTEFVKPATKQTSQVLGHNPENLHADGAYQSPDNIEHCREEEMSYYFTGIQGSPGRYNLELSEEQLTVTDTQTGEIIPVRRSKSGKWAIKTKKGYRYFTQQEIETCHLRKEIKQMPVEKRMKRNNVEATIFQLCYHTRNNKTRYRGKIKHKMWAILRCLWINIRRIIIYMGKIYQKTGFLGLNSCNKSFFSKKIDHIAVVNSIFCLWQFFSRFFSLPYPKLEFKKLYFS